MNYATHSPFAPLLGCIERFWFCSEAPPEALEHLPGGAFELVINLGRDPLGVRTAGQEAWRELSGAVVAGAYSRCFAAEGGYFDPSCTPAELRRRTGPHLLSVPTPVRDTP